MSSYMKMGNEAIDEILKEVGYECYKRENDRFLHVTNGEMSLQTFFLYFSKIAMASHVPELAITYTSMMQDCGGWR